MNVPVLFFAAGLGTRMGDLTKDKPKSLIQVGGKALIDHALGIADLPQVGTKVVNLHYHGEMIRQHLAGQEVRFSDEKGALLETGGGLRHALPLLVENPVLTVNTDAVWSGPNPVQTVLDSWRLEMEALLLVVKKPNVFGHLGKGDFSIDANGRLHRASDVIYTGVQIIRTDVLAQIDAPAFSMNIVWNIIAERGGLFGAVYDGKWCDVGQPSSIVQAEAMLNV